jgi:hypothetical protein
LSRHLGLFLFLLCVLLNLDHIIGSIAGVTGRVFNWLLNDTQVKTLPLFIRHVIKVPRVEVRKERRFIQSYHVLRIVDLSGLD